MCGVLTKKKNAKNRMRRFSGSASATERPWRLARAQAVAARQAALQAQVRVRAAVPIQVWPDQQFEQWVFQQDSNADGARRRFDSQLSMQVEDIDHACHLADAQKKKLQLMGQGDMKRFFDRFELAKHKFNLLNNDVQHLQDVQQDVGPLRTILQSGLFGANSLLEKALRHVLTAEQFTRYDAVVQERNAFRHRAQIQLAIEMVEQSVPLRDAQRRDSIALLVKETKPARVWNQYGFYLTMYQIGRVPEEKVKPLLTDVQWKVLERQVNQYKAIVPNLRQNGLLPEEDEDADPAPCSRKNKPEEGYAAIARSGTGVPCRHGRRLGPAAQRQHRRSRAARRARNLRQGSAIPGQDPNAKRRLDRRPIRARDHRTIVDGVSRVW